MLKGKMRMDQTVINNLYRLLKKEDLTPHGFAIKYSMNVRTVTNIFQGNCNPRTDTLEQIAKCFNTTVAELYEDNDKKETTDIQKRFEKYDTYQQGCIVGYMDRLDDELDK